MYDRYQPDKFRRTPKAMRVFDSSQFLDHGKFQERWQYKDPWPATEGLTSPNAVSFSRTHHIQRN
jgi:hypothetical protein